MRNIYQVLGRLSFGSTNWAQILRELQYWGLRAIWLTIHDSCKVKLNEKQSSALNKPYIYHPLMEFEATAYGASDWIPNFVPVARTRTSACRVPIWS